MLNNEKGNSLITVLVTTLILTTLGLTVIAASIGGAERTELRESDIQITYEATKLADEITSNLVVGLNQFSIASLINNPVDLITQTTSFVRTNVGTILSPLNLGNATLNTSSIACVSVVDVTESSPISLLNTNYNGNCSTTSISSLPTLNLTNSTSRVYEIVIETKNSEETQANIGRTLRKRVILTPLPSFLQYALGAGETLILNGSPTIHGDIYAGSISITDQANYCEGSCTSYKTANSLMPAIYGDIFSNNPAILPTIKPENFYKNSLPKVKGDSQFTNIELVKGFEEQKERILTDVRAGNTKVNLLSSSPDNVVTSVVNGVGKKLIDLLPILDKENAGPLTGIGNLIGGILPKPVEEIIDLDGVFTNATALVDPVITPGTKLLTHTGDVVLTNLNNTLSLPDLFVDGDVIILGNNLLNLQNIVATGDIKIVSLDNSIKLPNTSRLISLGDIEVDALSEVLLEGDMYAAGDILLKTTDTKDFKLTGTILSENNLTISGNSSDSDSEDDFIQFDSVIYSLGKATVSNLGIEKANEGGQLILLSGGNMDISRINEFDYFSDYRENEVGLPKDINSGISPLEAFFYTDKNAELYGVGSSFFVNGGVFAREKLTINAIRGEVNSISEVVSTLSDTQEDKLSRFIVDYKRDIILQNIDALPRPSKLRLITDQQIVE